MCLSCVCILHLTKFPHPVQELDHEQVRKFGQALGEVSGAFTCGTFEGAALFVVSYQDSFRESGGYRYAFGNWR